MILVALGAVGAGVTKLWQMLRRRREPSPRPDETTRPPDPADPTRGGPDR